MKKDIVIFTNGNLFAYVILKDFVEKYKSRISCVVLVSGDYKGNSGLKALYLYFKSVTLSFFLYKLFTLIIIKILKITNPSQTWDVKSLCIKNGINNLITTPNIKDVQLFNSIQQLNAEYLVSVSCPQFISKKWISLYNEKVINIHSSDLPAYAGLAPYYWVLSNNESKTATTVHYVTPKFDAGNILEKAELKIENNISVFRLFFQLSKLGSKIIIKAFEKMQQNNPGQMQDLTRYSYYSNPDLKSYRSLKRNNFKLFTFKDIKYIINNI